MCNQTRCYPKLILPVFFVIAFFASSASATELVEASIETPLLPKPVEYAVLLPNGYEGSSDTYPLLLFLHGGGGDRRFLTRLRPVIEEMWSSGALPKMVVVTPSAGRSFYMDYKDGSQKWESFITGPLLEVLRSRYRIDHDRKGTFIFGISMGGLGALRMGFKYPEKFAAVVALEPGIDPALKWKDVKPRNRFYRSDQLFETIFGRPFDERYWELNNPASIALANADRIRKSGLQIYLDAGDQDVLNLHEAAEFLHRLLWDNNIPHEYHLVRGADHVGRSIKPRTTDGLAFLGRVINPSTPDPEAEAFRRQVDPLKRAAERKQ
jgi:S-formylglutathione hydrolase